MKKLKLAIHKIISEKSGVDWLIVHDVSKSSLETDDVEFSFVDGKERENEPFKTNQGYISPKTPDAINKFEEMVGELFKEFKSNTVALVNLFILITRASYNGEDKGTLIKNFKKCLLYKTRQALFDILIDSLNSEYYKHNHSVQKRPESTNEWLDLFHSTQYMHGFSDPLMSCLQLVRTVQDHKLSFNLIENMNPLLRSVLMGWYGFGLNVSKEKLDQCSENEGELAFLSACIIHDTSPDKTPPNWLSQNLIEIYIEKYWEKIGEQIFVHVFGLSNYNKNKNKLYEKLEALIHEVLFKKLSLKASETKEWISKLEFPNDFIALFAWFSMKKIDCSNIPSYNRAAIRNQFVAELKRISKEIPVYFASKNSNDPFNSYQLYEGKYQNALAYFLLFLLYATQNNKKDITKVCFQFKSLFYGGFQACSLATRFSEVMLLIGLSGYKLDGLGKDEFESLKEYVEMLAETILVPYIHLAERDDEIWNPESERKLLQYNAGRYLVNTALSDIKNHEVCQHYRDFFKSIDEVKVARWPYERTQKNTN